MQAAFEIKTAIGLMKGKAGDYLVTGIDGDRFPMDKDKFEDNYVEVKTKK